MRSPRTTRPAIPVNARCSGDEVGTLPTGLEELMVTLAALQATPVFLDREATTDKVCALVNDAAGGGAELIVIPESYIPAFGDALA